MVALTTRTGEQRRSDGTPKLKTWEIDLDSSGYAFDIAGYMEPELVPCTTDVDCVASLGGACTALGNPCTSDAQCHIFEACRGSTCDYPTGIGGYCAPA